MTYIGQGHWILTVGFLVLMYSVVCTVESLFLFYLISNIDLYVQGDDASMS